MRNKPLYQQIFNELIHDIRSGKYSVGDKLPSEKEISIQYNVSRITSKNALDKLADMGMIIRMPGKGSFVTEDKMKANQDPNEYVLKDSSRVIGLIMDGFGASFGHKLVLSIESECKRNNISLALRCTYGSIDAENQAIDEMIALGVSGIIIMCVHQDNFNSKVLKLIVDRFPIVVIDRRLKSIPVTFVGTDNESAAKELTEYVFGRGYNNICFVSPDSIDTPTIYERYKGFSECCKEHGVISPETITSLRSTLPESRTESNLQLDIEIITEFIKTYPHVDSFFAVEYDIAKILKRTLCGLGLEKDCLVVCFDSIDNILGEVEFTHIHQRENEIGKNAVLCLVNLIKGNNSADTILVPYDIYEANDQ